jgi:hypothetical protein
VVFFGVQQVLPLVSAELLGIPKVREPLQRRERAVREAFSRTKRAARPAVREQSSRAHLTAVQRDL